jgi:hypothetical protein
MRPHEEIIELVNVTINQNYFKINNTYWQQQNGTLMGSSVSNVPAEIFLQELENKFYPNIINTRHIQYIAKYDDDVLIIYNTATITAETIL